MSAEQPAGGQWGTLVDMRGLRAVLEIDEKAETVTVDAGWYYIDVARALEKKGYQFEVNTEMGNVTVGAAASAGTKDSTFPEGSGQIGASVLWMRVVNPDGSVQQVGRDHEDFGVYQSHHGLFGIVTRVCFRIVKERHMRLSHDAMDFDDLLRKLPAAEPR